MVQTLDRVAVIGGGGVRVPLLLRGLLRRQNRPASGKFPSTIPMGRAFGRSSHWERRWRRQDTGTSLGSVTRPLRSQANSVASSVWRSLRFRSGTRDSIISGGSRPCAPLART